MKKTMPYNAVHCANCSFLNVCTTANNIPEISSIVKKVLIADRGDVICRANQKLTDYLVVCSGLLQAYETKADSKTYIPNFYFQGDVIGIDAFYKMKFDFTINSISNAILCVIPRDAINYLIERKPQIYENILRIASRQIISRYYLIYIDVDQRLAGFLLELIERLNIIQDDMVTLPIKQIDIAAHLNITPETINRILHRWQDRGIISEMRNKKFMLPDINKLREICL